MLPDRPNLTADLLLGAVELLAIAVIFASFQTWIRFDATETLQDGPHLSSVKVSGDDLKGVTDLGDGALTAIAGALAGAFAITSRFASGARGWLGAGIAVAGLTTFGVAGYDIVKDWAGGGTGVLIAVQVDVIRYLAMFATAALGLAQGLAGIALFLMAQGARQQAALAEEESGEVETWAS